MGDSIEEENYRSLKVPEQRNELRKRGHATSRNKNDLIQRLLDGEPDTDDDDLDYSSWTVSQLKEELLLREHIEQASLKTLFKKRKKSRRQFF